MSMDYIRRYYGVPAKRGGRVIANGKPGVIVGAQGQYLRVRIDGEKAVGNWHPDWNMIYLHQEAAK